MKLALPTDVIGFDVEMWTWNAALSHADQPHLRQILNYTEFCEQAFGDNAVWWPVDQDIVSITHGVVDHWGI